MSYSVKKTFSVAYTDHEYSVSGPGADKVSVHSHPVTRYKDVSVNVHVDTTHFDSSVNHCSGRVQGLTGAIVGFQTANVASKQVNERAITDRVTGGFLNMIEQNINLQNAGMEAEATALAGELMQQCKELGHKHDVMEKDYHRIKSRYADLFNTLNKELSNRIHALIKPCFDFVERTDTERNRAAGNTLLSMATVGAKENDEARIAIQSTKIKSNATHLIDAARDYVIKNRSAQQTKECFSVDGPNQTYYAPAIVVEEHDTRLQAAVSYYITPIADNPQVKATLEQVVPTMKQRPMSNEQWQRIAEHFNSKLGALDDGTPHGRRIIEVMQGLFERNNMDTFVN